MGKAEREKVLTHYLERLRSGIVRTPLLNASPGQLGRGQKLDVATLAAPADPGHVTALFGEHLEAIRTEFETEVTLAG